MTPSFVRLSDPVFTRLLLRFPRELWWRQTNIQYFSIAGKCSNPNYLLCSLRIFENSLQFVDPRISG